MVNKPKPDPDLLLKTIKSDPGNLNRDILDEAFWREDNLADDGEVQALDQLERHKNKEPLKRLLIERGLPWVADFIERRVAPLPKGPPRTAPYTKSATAALNMLAHREVKALVKNGMPLLDALNKVAAGYGLNATTLGYSYKRGRKRSKT